MHTRAAPEAQHPWQAGWEEGFDGMFAQAQAHGWSLAGAAAAWQESMGASWDPHGAVQEMGNKQGLGWILHSTLEEFVCLTAERSEQSQDWQPVCAGGGWCQREALAQCGLKGEGSYSPLMLTYTPLSHQAC